jgi:adenylate cyclase class IV
MARNVEVKARIDSVEALAPRVAALADSGPSEILHEDTFFACAGGRLKLRIFSDTEGQLIFYRRPMLQVPRRVSTLFRLLPRLVHCSTRYRSLTARPVESRNAVHSS